MSIVETFDLSRVDGNQDICPICHESLISDPQDDQPQGELRGHTVSQPPLLMGSIHVQVSEAIYHIFHSNCLEQALLHDRICPMCRVPLTRLDTDEQRGQAMISALTTSQRALALRILGIGPVDQPSLEMVSMYAGDGDLELLRALLAQPNMTNALIDRIFEECFYNLDTLRELTPRVTGPLLISHAFQQIAGGSNHFDHLHSILSFVSIDQIEPDCIYLGLTGSISMGPTHLRNIEAILSQNRLPISDARKNSLCISALRNNNFPALELLAPYTHLTEELTGSIMSSTLPAEEKERILSLFQR